MNYTSCDMFTQEKLTTSKEKKHFLNFLFHFYQWHQHLFYLNWKIFYFFLFLQRTWQWLAYQTHTVGSGRAFSEHVLLPVHDVLQQKQRKCQTSVLLLCLLSGKISYQYFISPKSPLFYLFLSRQLDLSILTWWDSSKVSVNVFYSW